MKTFLLSAGLFLLALTAHATEITVGFRPVPPYVVQDPVTGQLSGLEYEIIVAAFTAQGYQVKPSVMPLARMADAFQARILEAAAPLLPTTVGSGTLSQSYLSYHNVVFVLKESHRNIQRVSDLSGLSMAAFQTAKRILGPEFTRVAETSPDYEEEAQQVLQVRMLFTGRVNAIVGDSRILNYYIHDPNVGVDTSKPVQEFPVFPPTNYGVGFRDPTVAAAFNVGLAAIRANGTYQRILDRYTH
jgi:polar amino acid transport system substrate-binding protein